MKQVRLTFTIITMSIMLFSCASNDSTKNESNSSCKSLCKVSAVGMSDAEMVAYALMLVSANCECDQNSNIDTDWDWAYNPGNNQWVCRGIETGKYAELENCDEDTPDDDRWPN